MESQQTQEELQVVYFREDHPWLEVQDEDLGDIRYSLDELRFA